MVQVRKKIHSTIFPVELFSLNRESRSSSCQKIFTKTRDYEKGYQVVQVALLNTTALILSTCCFFFSKSVHLVYNMCTMKQ